MTSTSSASSSWWPRGGGWSRRASRRSASAALGEALGLRRGEPLAEFAYAGFADAERAHLDELTLVAIEARAEADLALGRHGELVGELEALCRAAPAARAPVGAAHPRPVPELDARPRPCAPTPKSVTAWSTSSGIDPGPALRELEARILAQDPSLAPASARPARLRSRGRGADVQPGNLRERLSSFVGRDAELDQLREAVRSSRLVTLIGPGGVGKTRLAVEAAAALREEHRDGAWLVELAGVTDPDGVAPAAAAALGAAAAAALGSPSPPGSTTELIVRHLAGRSLVVVLDNCEHVIDEAAALADTLVGAVPGLRLIATSREPLGVPGEVLVPVGGLAPPAAVELFVDRARAVRPGFERRRARPATSSRISAAGWTACRWPSSSPPPASGRCRWPRWPNGSTTASGCSPAAPAPPCPASRRSAPWWTGATTCCSRTNAACSPGCRSSPAAASSTAAEAVCADDQVPAGEILDVLSRLVDKSLVTASGGAARPGSPSSRRCGSTAGNGSTNPAKPTPFAARHAAYYRQLATEAHQGLRGATGPAWRDRLDRGVGQPAGRARLVHRHGRCRRGAVAGLGDGLAVVHQQRLPRRSPLAR